MIKGLDKFRAHFAQHRKAYVLIGGVACHEWLASQGRQFRATRDIDVVLIIEALDQAFVARFWEFVEAGRYTIREKAEGRRELYRFSKPEDDTYPAMLEIFSRKPEGIDLGAGQHIVPVQIDEISASLSAILLDDAYYTLIREQHNEDADLPLANPVALIPLKARAWLDLTERQKKGQKVDERDIAKHRADVFRIAATLPGQPGPGLPNAVLEDLEAFLAAFPADSPEWPAILSSLKTTFPNIKLKPVDLVNSIRTYFRVA
jgi:hypothetical protein